MKAIIPVAGAGTKLRPLTYTQPKALIPIAGKTILGVIVDQLIDAGVTEFVFVIGYLGEKIQRYIDKRYPHLKHTFVTQNDRRGTGHAIWLTRDAVGDDEVMIVLGDTVCDYNVKEVLNSPVSQIGVRKVDDPRRFGVAELNDKDNVIRMVEKPLIPKSNMAMVGIYYIKETAAMYEALNRHLNDAADENGEYHLTSALQHMQEDGIVLHAFRVNNWFDCGKKETLLSTNAILLKQMEDEQRTRKLETYNNTVVIHPVNIAEGCDIRNSIIGPNVTIGENTKIESSIVKDSIIGSFAELHHVVLNSSIIGSDAYVRGLSQSLNIGDNTEIDLA
ncbi:glucose-1-phosphate thymidylyltransferase [Flavipsychrobacter stenotrophus]|uniref:Glucose-1-phosphate thymidylyltransferase n=1 Tax=Flavipsychrobacter stenotrophus TaxID=2077091 RepID=A0A2S7SVK3_9BACT|nr:sugar phosphate nucleotidyltransferase [Flavipsychrobacter stenotrophus]PQJ10566.1 glucose-1-phosphate thymidylyltransferase [Flavipsychrobacter stenotrophus]